MNAEPTPTRARQWLGELRGLARAGLRNFLSRIWVLLLIVLFGVLAVRFQHGEDRALLDAIRCDNPSIIALARTASDVGDWYLWAALGGILWAWGAAKNQLRWRTAGLVCLLATLLAGITINCFRPTMGRPRPYTNLPDGLYGPTLRRDYHSFMSGHTAASFAAASGLAIIAPPVGIPALGGAVLVGWSRLELQKHNPSDVLVGGAAGLLCGWSLARAAWTRERKAK